MSCGQKKKGLKGRVPAHQNTFKFKHNKNSSKTRQILGSPIEGMCRRCTEIIEWRKTYRKYKPLKKPAICLDCKQRSITHAYHTLCLKCARARGNVCAKCRNEEEEVIVEMKTEKEKIAEELHHGDYVAGMKESDRRTYFRKVEKGEVVDEVPPKVETTTTTVKSDKSGEQGNVDAENATTIDESGVQEENEVE